MNRTLATLVLAVAATGAVAGCGATDGTSGDGSPVSTTSESLRSGYTYHDGFEFNTSEWSYYSTNPAGAWGISNSAGYAHDGTHFAWEAFYPGSTASDWSALSKTFTAPAAGPVTECDAIIYFWAIYPIKGSLEMINPSNNTYIGYTRIDVPAASGWNHVPVHNTYACSNSITLRFVLDGPGTTLVYLDTVGMNFTQ